MEWEVERRAPHLDRHFRSTASCCLGFSACIISIIVALPRGVTLALESCREERWHQCSKEMLYLLDYGAGSELIIVLKD